MLKKWFSLMAAALLSTSLVAAEVPEPDPSVNMKDPYDMVHQVADQVFSRIKAEQSDIQSDPETLRTIVREELLPYIDYRYAAFSVIGRNIRKTTESGRAEFVDVFTQYLVTTYAQTLTLYKGQRVEFEPKGKVREGDTIVTVPSVIKEAGKPDIRILFKLRQNSKTGEWRAFDMIAEGVSMLSAKQSELSPIIGSEGLDAVTEMLRDKANQAITLKDDKADS